MNESHYPPPVLVEDQDQLKQLVSVLKEEKRIGVDTESNSLYVYKEQVCLIQISTKDTDYLVDPLRLKDVSCLGSVLSHPGTEKILHGAEYDVICLKRDFGFQINNLFDSRVACRTLGRKKTGLADILNSEFNVQVNKRWQRANWGKRPLPAEQLHYARMDTHYLIQLRDRLADDLNAASRWEEAYEECQRLTRIPLPDNGFDPHGFWKITNSRKLAPAEQAVLRELYLMRDKIASRTNRPPFKILGNATLLEISRKRPRHLDNLASIPGMTQGQIRRLGKEILAATSKGMKAQPPRKPASPRADEKTVMRYKHLLEWRKETARSRQVESDVILSRDILWDIAKENPTGMEELEKLFREMPWRFDSYGKSIIYELSTLKTSQPKRKV